MAVIPRNANAAEIGCPYPSKAEIFDFAVAANVLPGNGLYETTGGQVAPSNAGAAGTVNTFAGVALTKKNAKGTVSVVQRGHVVGFDVSAMNCGAPVYASNTAGELDTAAGTVSLIVGRVTMLPDGVKCIFVECPRR